VIPKQSLKSALEVVRLRNIPEHPSLMNLNMLIPQVSEFIACSVALSLEGKPLCGTVEGMDADDRAYRDVFTACPAKGFALQATTSADSTGFD